MLVLTENSVVSSFVIVTAPRAVWFKNHDSYNDYNHYNTHHYNLLVHTRSERKTYNHYLSSTHTIKTYRQLDTGKKMYQNNNECTYHWKNTQDVEIEAKKLNISKNEYIDWNVRVTVYDDDDDDDESENPILFQIRQYDNHNKNNSTQQKPPAPAPRPAASSCTHLSLEQSNSITDNMIRWCTNFVTKLNLCPWAKSSISTPDAIRIKIIPQSAGWNYMEQIIRSSSYELIRVTTPPPPSSSLTNNNNNKQQKMVDPNIAITFVVVAPNNNNYNNNNNGGGGWETDEDFEFLSFYQHFSNLEDTLFQEADDAASQRDNDRSLEELLFLKNGDKDDDIIFLGDHITLAPFHPDWTFSSSQEDEQSPLDFEKQTPYPTISLVRSSAVMAAGEETTIRIGSHNEQILQDLGTDTLKSIYHENVYKNDSN